MCWKRCKEQVFLFDKLSSCERLHRIKTLHGKIHVMFNRTGVNDLKTPTNIEAPNAIYSSTQSKITTYQRKNRPSPSSHFKSPSYLLWQGARSAALGLDTRRHAADRGVVGVAGAGSGGGSRLGTLFVLRRSKGLRPLERRLQVREVRAPRHNAMRVDALVALKVVVLDVRKVDRRLDTRHLVDLLQVVVHVRVVDDAAQVCLEVQHVDGVEADERGEEPDVGLGHLGACQVALAGQDCLDTVQRVKELREGLVVGLLLHGKAAAVDAVVDGRVHPLVDCVNLSPQRLRVKVQARLLLCGAQCVELRVQHADDL
eukprot:m.99305 g.99305  ORF g.99305 m.99305 type:complete len:314 (+) comp15584_c0_seq2:134-1075(+)